MNYTDEQLDQIENTHKNLLDMEDDKTIGYHNKKDLTATNVIRSFLYILAPNQKQLLRMGKSSLCIRNGYQIRLRSL